MVRVQMLLACRPGELCSMTLDQIDRSGEVWLYRPRIFKTQHHKGKTRIIPIGPRAQLLIKPMLPPFEAMPVFRGKRKKQFAVTYYRQQIYNACDAAGVDRWHPNMLRHSGATRIRQQASLDAAQVILGHSTISMTQHYAERNVEAAVQIAGKIG
jgi:integrase